jgi:hypothetical protein
MKQKISRFPSHLEVRAMSFLNRSSAILLLVVTDIKLHQKIKVITNFQRIEKRNFGVIP